MGARLHGKGEADSAAYEISAGRTLTPIACDSATGSVCNGNNFLTGSYTSKIVIDVAGKYIYTNNSGTITLLRIASGGELVPISCSGSNSITCKTFTDGSNSISSYVVGSVLGHIRLDPSGQFLYGATKGLTVLATSTSGSRTPVPCICGAGMSCVTDTVNTTTFSNYPNR